MTSTWMGKLKRKSLMRLKRNKSAINKRKPQRCAVGWKSSNRSTIRSRPRLVSISQRKPKSWRRLIPRLLNT